MRVCILSFFLMLLGSFQQVIWSQVETRTSIDSTTNLSLTEKKVLSEGSYLVLKSTMDSILLELLNQQNELQRDLELINEETVKANDVTTKEQLQLQLQRLTIDQNEVRELRRKAIDLQLQLSYNPTSFSCGEAVKSFLKGNYNITMPILHIEKEKITNERFHFKVNQMEDNIFDKPCQIVFNDIDYEVNKPRKESSSQPFFKYTNAKLKSYFKEKNYLTCRAASIKLGKDYILNLDIDIASKDANRSYGYIEKSSIIMFEFINGEKVYAEAIRRASGQLNEEGTHTSYDIFYKLDKSSRKQLSNREISNVGLFWSTGFEKYRIYEVDLLMIQLKCIN